MTLPAATLLLIAALPELLPQHGLRPLAGIAIWLAALGARALIAVLATVLAVAYLPATQLFAAITKWCLDDVPPFLSSHVGLSGHGIGEIALLVPALIVTASLLWASLVIARSVRTAARWLKSSRLGSGPASSVIVSGPEVLVAAAGLRTPRIVVSTGALTHLDEAELDASLKHERGHIDRRHRYAFLIVSLLLGIARFVPGSRRASRHVRFHLERDADEFALRRGADPLALASAICKAARSVAPAPVAVAQLGGADTASRLRHLLGAQPTNRPLTRWSSGTAAIVVVGTVLVFAPLAAGLASATAGQLHLPSAIVSCA